MLQTDPLVTSVSGAPFAQALLDRSLRFVAYSDRWISEHGLDPEHDYRGQRHDDVLPGAGDAVRASLQRGLEGHAAPSDLVPSEGPDGRRRWLRREARPWWRPDGEVGGVLLVAEDLTAALEEGRAPSHGDALIEAAAHADATLWAFDENRRMTLHVGAPLEALGVGQGWNVGEDMADVYGDLPGFVDMLDRVLAGDRERSHVEVADRSFDTLASPICAGEAVRGGIGISIDVTDRVRAERRAETQTANLRRLLQATATRGAFQERAQAVLRAMASLLGLRDGLLARVTGDRFTGLVDTRGAVGAQPPDAERPLEDTYCALPLEAGDVVAVEHLAHSPYRARRCYEVAGLEAFIGAPVVVDDKLFGALSFTSPDPVARPFTEGDRELVRLAAQWVGTLIERDRREQEASAQTERLRQLADIFSVRSVDDTDLIAVMLDRLRGLLGMATGVLGRTTPEIDIFEVFAYSGPENARLAVGNTFSLGTTYGSIALAEGDTTAIDVMSASPYHRHPCFEAFGLETYIGSPVFVDGSIYGTLNFSAAQPREAPFSAADRDLVRLAAQWAGGVLEREIRQRRLEEAIDMLAEARDQADTANRAKSAFLASMSHEIRTPMNAVIGFSELLGMSPLDEDQLDYVQTIQRSGDRLLSLIDDILDFSKVEAGRVELDPTPASIRDLVTQALEEAAPRASEKGLELAYTVAAEVPDQVLVDEKRMLQILANLIANGVKFTGVGSVEVSVRPAREAPRPAVGDEVWVEIEVTDTGIGIRPERLVDVFEPFVQEDGSTTRAYGGTGLGLAITRRFVTLMGGVLDAESEPGVGSTFRVRVPLARARGARRIVMQTTAGTLTGRHALIVDDDPGSLDVLQLQLGRWGMTADATLDPEVALAWIAEGRSYDVGLLDMVMPDPDGVHLAEAVRRLRTSIELPLVILSSADQRRHPPDVAAATLTKPVPPPMLHNHLRRVLHIRDRPEASPGAPSPAAVEAVRPHPPCCRILIVEDEPDNQAVALQMLSRLGYRADVASDGEEALERLAHHDYDVVLMDVMMPRLDGLEATRRLRVELPEHRQPRVIALTARARRSDREACLAAGMDDFLTKPVRLDALRSVLPPSSRAA